MSWVAQIFNPAHAQSQPYQSILFSKIRHDAHHDDADCHSTTDQELAHPMDEEEEAARSPYWHVRIQPEFRS